MHAKIMEGLVGASTNVSIMSAPMRVYKEASRKENTSVMEKAMEYVAEFGGKAEQYRAKANEGTKEEAEEAREKAESDREKIIEKRRQERDELEARMREGTSQASNTAQAREAGKVVFKGRTASDETTSKAAANNTTGKGPVLYNKEGQASKMEQGSNKVYYA